MNYGEHRQQQNQNNRNPYDDIINMPHHVSRTRPQMSVRNRAAQFAPFAALTGYGDAVNETARLTDQKIELDESNKQILDEKLQIIQNYVAEHASEHTSEHASAIPAGTDAELSTESESKTASGPEVTITYFKPDEKKAGGSYVTVTGTFRKIDIYDHAVVFEDRSRYRIDDIVDLQCDLFRYIEDL